MKTKKIKHKKHSKTRGRGIITNTKSILKKTANNGPKKKQIIRLNLQKNKTHTYHLSSDEKREKRSKNLDINECTNSSDNNYPCKYNDTVFYSEDEYNEYKQMKQERNISTGHKSRSIHYKEIESKTGTLGKKIPKENRLHDPYTGKIYDKTTLRFGDKLLVNY